MRRARPKAPRGQAAGAPTPQYGATRCPVVTSRPVPVPVPMPTPPAATAAVPWRRRPAAPAGGGAGAV